MKVNLPVTQTERRLEPGQPIVTKTDLQGRITYANESFVSISGYSRAELIGAHHHIVRHPDMPQAAFADLWRCVNAGQPWRGLVKNRCKNGDFYWVEAYVTPILKEDAMVGFMSVRNAPARGAIEAAEALYARTRKSPSAMPATPIYAGRFGLGSIACASYAAVAAAALLPGPARLAAIPLAAWSAYWMWRNVAQPVATANAALSLIGEGQLQRNLTTPRPGALDGLLLQIESLRINLRATFCDVLLASKSVSASAERLDGEIGALATESGQQVDRVAQIAAAMEQMSVSIAEISENTRVSLNTSREARNTVTESGTQLEQSIERTQRVVDVVRESAAQFDRLSAAVGRIGNITSTITEVANRTNLLALNAAIEAARAGEQGRGFAVVADEVRKLAEQTASSTVDIARTVEEINAVTRAADASMKAAAAEVDGSAAAIRLSTTGLTSIRDSSDSVVKAASEISDMLKEQSSASHEVASNMERISETIDRANTSLGGVSATSRSLKATAADMRELIAHLEGALA